MKYDWIAIKKKYLSSHISIRELAEQEKIPYRTLSNRSNSECWSEERRKFKAKREKKTVEKAVEKISNLDSDKLVKAVQIVDSFSDHLQTMMKDKDQFKRRSFVNTDSGQLIDVISDKYDTKAMKEASEALKNLVELTRNVYNLPLAQEQQTNNSIEVVFTSDMDKYTN